MNKQVHLAACAAGLAVGALVVLAAPGQEQTDEVAEAAEGASAVGFVDVAYLYKHYSKFTDMMADLKTEVDQAEKEVKQSRESLEALQQQLRLHPTGSPEYATLEEKIAKLRADVAASVETQKKVFLRREARLYYDVYQEIREEVEEYAAEHNVALVLRARDEKVNVGDPKQVLQHINSHILYYDKRRDLTRLILQRLEQRAEPPEAEPPEAEPPEAEQAR